MAARRLTVLQILPALESGGVERGTLEVATALVAAGHRSIVVSTGGRLVDELVDGGSEHIHLPVARKSPLTLLQVRPLRKILRREQVDILHARSRVPGWVSWLAWRGMDVRTRPRFVTTVHGLYSVNHYSAIMTKGERVIAVSDTARKYIIDNYSEVDADKVVTIYRGVDPAEFPYGYQPSSDWLAGWYGAYPFLRGCKVLTLPGRLTRLKGHVDFIELVAELVSRGLNVHGLIVGHLDPARQAYIRELQRLITEQGMEERITFTGRRDDMREIYAVSDLVLSLSNKPESFGRAVLEPLSMGVPAVGYDHGGVGEILARINPAGRVPTGDRRTLAKRVANLLEAPPRISPCDDFTRDAMLASTLELYQELVNHSAVDAPD